MRWSRLALVVLCSCEKLFSLDVVEPPPPSDATDAQPADAAEPALAKWTVSRSLASGRDYNHPHAAFVGDTLYLIGGYDVGLLAESDVVYRATSNDGELGEWTTTTALPAPRALGDIVTIDARIYVVGGANGGGAQPSVYVGEPDAAGAIPSWAALPDLPEARKAHAAVASSGYLYAVGGADGANARQATVFYAPIRTDGTLGSWQVTMPLPGPRANHGSVAARGFMYAIGGDESDTTTLSTVFVAEVDPNTGQLGSWATTTPLPVARKALVALTDGTYIYVIGGLGASATTEVRYSRIGDDGTLGTWETSEPLLMPRYRHAGALANGHLFVLGGALAATSVEHSSQGPR